MGQLAVAEATEAFLGSLRSRQVPTNTLKAYRSDLACFARSVPADLGAVDVAAIRAFLGSGGAAATSRRRHASLRSFYRWLVREELVALNPMERVDAVEVPARLPRPMAADQPEAVLAAIPTAATRDRALFWVLYETGMRVGEALSIQRGDVDLSPDDEKLRVLGKGQRERTVLLAAAPQSVRLLRRHLRLSGIRSGSVFRGDPNRGGTNLAMDYTTVRRAWQRYCAKAGVEATIHQLRHSRTSQLVRDGVPLTTVRKLLGHRSIQTTMLYAEVDDETVKRDLLDYQHKRPRRR
ncbi:MAG: tyrosine-type recombinase/integrase [Acidimicrobiales bacterium]